MVAETGGNPLALLELPRGLTAAGLEFGSGRADRTQLSNRIEAGFLRQLQPLPDDTRRLLVIAAVEPLSDVPLLWRAAQSLGIDRDAAAPAETAGLIEFGVQVRFRHPLVRSAGALTTNLVTLTPQAGGFLNIPMALDYRASFHVHAGQFAAASALPGEAAAIKEATGSTPALTPIELAAWRGHEGQALELVQTSIPFWTARGDGRWISLAEYARAVLFNGLGRYEAALNAALPRCHRPPGRDAHASGPRACPPALRRVAATREPAS